MKSAIIMAAGKGTRMQSGAPKVMHKVCQKTMIEHIVDNLKKIEVSQIVTVVGYGASVIEEAMHGKTEFALQDPQLGTGHAVMQAKQLEKNSGLTLVVNGDCPCVEASTYQSMFDNMEGCSMLVLTAILEDPKSYGRVIRNSEGFIEKIVEFKDANEEEKAIHEINTGIYCFDNQLLFSSLSEIKNNNAQNEYYIIDLVAILNKKGYKVKGLVATDQQEVAGINDQIELASANQWLQAKINNEWMRRGVTLINPADTYIGADVILNKEVIIYPNNYLQGKTTIGVGTTLLPGCFLIDATIGEHCMIDSSRITESVIHDHVRIGPFAHLRMNCDIADKNRIGNFVELKNTKLGIDSRCAHLTYLGDSTVGSKVNMGCGVVTVNYDGKNKFETIVKDGAFIGSNVNLIAPITIGKNAVVAAGTTANKDVLDGEMAIARPRQENKPGYGLKYKDK